MKKIIILFIISLSILTGCIKKEDVKIKQKITEIEYNTKLNISDIVDIENLKIINDKKVDTSSLGNQKINIKYEDNNGKIHNTKVTIDVVDKTKPLLIHPQKFTFKAGSKVDLLDKVICGDNYDANLRCEIEGEYNFNEVGEYNLFYTATDINGNETKSPFTLNIKKELSNSGNSSSNVEISKFINNYKNESTEIGIDVSTWQGDIDYEKVKNAGIDFVMIRIVFSTTKGNIILDNQYEANIEKAKEAGLKVGVYFYSKASSLKMARDEAKWGVEQLKNITLELPIAFDWECWSDFNSFHISYTNLNDIALEFLNEVENSGYKGIIYGSASYLEKIWKIEDYSTWLAHYTKKTDYEKEFMMWQQTASGLVPGFEGNVDLNILYK